MSSEGILALQSLVGNFGEWFPLYEMSALKWIHE
uniref:Uncharacterized protein n=1 Tax=Rhizophora mucronata TaxID=61149 RepID=A0A2P2QHK3_RHIMU